MWDGPFANRFELMKVDCNLKATKYVVCVLPDFLFPFVFGALRMKIHNVQKFIALF